MKKCLAVVSMLAVAAAVAAPHHRPVAPAPRPVVKPALVVKPAPRPVVKPLPPPPPPSPVVKPLPPPPAPRPVVKPLPPPPHRPLPPPPPPKPKKRFWFF